MQWSPLKNHLNGKIDFTKQYGMDDHKSKIKFELNNSILLEIFKTLVKYINKIIKKNFNGIINLDYQNIRL